MDVHFIEIRYKVKEIKNINKLLSVIPRKVCIVSTIQYLDIANTLREQLRKHGVEVITKKSEKLQYEMQVIGCDVSAADCEADVVIFVGDGEFHGKEIINKLNKKVIIYNPLSGEINVLDNKQNYLYLLGILSCAEKIGIVTSIKPGQFRLNEIITIKNTLKDEGKKVYLFIGDNIDVKEAINYNIDFWIIAACPRIYEDFIKNNLPAVSIDYYLTNYCRNHRLSKSPESKASKGSNDKKQYRRHY